MANYSTLKAAINAVIKTNGQKEITGEVLNQVLNAMVTSLGSNYQFAGVATPSTNPGTPDQNVFYMATEAGTYTNFNATVLPAGISILLWNGSWSHETFFEIDSVPTSGSDNLVSSGAVFEKMKLDGGAYDVSAHNGDATFASLSALLNNENLNTLIPVAVRHGGMSIKFVQSSDNKYISYRLTKDEWSTAVSDWEKQDINEIYQIVEGYELEAGGRNIDNSMTIIPENASPSDSYHTLLIKVKAGETYEIVGYAATVDFLLWATGGLSATSVRTIKRRTETRDAREVPQIVTIANDEQYLCVNVINDYPYYVRNITGVQKQLTTIDEKIAEVESDYNDKDAVLDDNIKAIGDVTCFESNGIHISGSVVENTVTGDYIHLIIPVNTGDTYTLKGLGGNATRLWAFANDLYIITRKADADVDARTESAKITLTAASGEKFLIVNVNSTTIYNLRYEGKLYDRTISDVTSPTTQVRFKAGYVLHNYSSSFGGVVENASYQSAIVPCKKGDIFIVNNIKGGYYRAIAVMQADGTITRQTELSQTIYEPLTIVIGDNEKFITFNHNSTTDAADVVKIGSIDYDTITLAAAGSSNADKAAADYVCNLGSCGADITNFLIYGWKTVKFKAGTYNMTSPVYLYESNTSLIGSVGTEFHRTDGYMVICQNNNLEYIYIEGINFTGRDIACVLFGHKDSLYWEVKNILMDGLSINHAKIKTGGTQQTYTCGVGKDFDSFADCHIFAKSWGASTTRIEVYGHHTVDGTDTAHQFIRPIELVGMTEDACIEYASDNTGEFIFNDINAFPQNRTKVRDLKFLRTGEMDAYNVMCVRILSSYCKFYNCVFQNDTSSPVAFNQATDTTGTGINTHGDRRHGCQIECKNTGVECEVELHDCIGIGSPYGFKNTRGYYLWSGSPKLYGCTGIGGGIGERGYGIVAHRHSQAYLYDCVGIGSPYGYRLANGIQFQANTLTECYHCIAKGGTGYQYISTGGRDNYVKQNTITGASHGFGFIMDVAPKLIDCIGYAGDGAGDGEESRAIYCLDQAHPIITGGYYGKETLVKAFEWKKDSGQVYMSLQIGNDNRDCIITDVYFENTGNILDSSKKLVIKTGNTLIAEMACSTQEMMLPITNSELLANAPLTAYIQNTDGTDAGVADNTNLRITIRWKVNNQMCVAYLGGQSYPQISNCVMDGNELADGIHIASTGDYLVSECTSLVKNKSIKANSDINNARVVDCVFSSSAVEHITGYITTTSMGSNITV